MLQATQDLEVLDKERKKNFKEYELEKEYLHKKKMDGLDDTHKKEEEHKWDEQKKKHADHPKLHHPVSFHSPFTSIDFSMMRTADCCTAH